MFATNDTSVVHTMRYDIKLHLETVDSITSGGPQHEYLVVPPAFDRPELGPEDGGVADSLSDFHARGFHRLLLGTQLSLVPCKQQAHLRHLFGERRQAQGLLLTILITT